jgi:hypothetical protein
MPFSFAIDRGGTFTDIYAEVSTILLQNGRSASQPRERQANASCVPQPIRYTAPSLRTCLHCPGA